MFVRAVGLSERACKPLAVIVQVPAATMVQFHWPLMFISQLYLHGFSESTGLGLGGSDT